LEEHDHVPNDLFVCLSYQESTMDIHRRSFSFVIYMDVLLSFPNFNRIFLMKLFDVFFRLVFDLGGRSPNTLIIRDWLITIQISI